jgi:hypothetical protein
MLEINCVTVGVKAISGTWPQGYTDLRAPVTNSVTVNASIK